MGTSSTPPAVGSSEGKRTRDTLRSSSRQNTLFFWAAVVALLVGGTALSVGFYRGEQQRQVTSLEARVNSMGAFITPAQLAPLHGDSSDLSRPAYLVLKAQMHKLVGLNPDMRFAYLLGADKQGLFFYGDSESPSSKDYSAPGDRYPEASAELLASFKNARPFVEGPTSDSFGTWVSGLYPIVGPGGKVVAVFGADIAYDNYRNKLLLVALAPASIVVVMLLILTVYYRMRRREQASFDLKAELVSVASHDIRSPLTGIQWAAQSIAEAPAGPASKELAGAIVSTAVELRATVNTLLSLAVEERGLASQPQCADIALKTMVGEIVAVLTLTARERQVRLSVDRSITAGDTIYGDEEKLKRVVANIIGNAIKYTKASGTVVVGYAKTPVTDSIWVRDQGIGIPAAELAAVQQGYHRAANVARSSVEGTGIGMLLARRIVAAHGGQLRIESTEGVGTTCTIELPRKPV